LYPPRAAVAWGGFTPAPINPMPETLTSPKNPLLREVRRAIARGSLTGDGLAVAEGVHLLEEALASRVEIGTVILAESARGRVDSLVSRLAGRVVAVSDDAFAGLASTESPQGVIALVRLPAWKLDDVLRKPALAIVLDGVQDPGNAGAIVRTGEAFGATGVIFLKGTVHPHNPKCLRASAGSLFRLPVIAAATEEAMLEELARREVRLFTTGPRAERLLSRTDLTVGCAVAIGGEGRGVAPALAARATAIRIPTSGVESLNAAVAAGVVLYEARRQRESS
jgi:TrmH family RNA methyltransferase